MILYNVDKEAYFDVTMYVIDPHEYYADYDMTRKIEKDLVDSFDEERQAYRVSGEFWEDFKEKLEEWLKDAETSYIRTIGEERYYAIAKAEPLYKVYDKYGEWCNETGADTLEMAKVCYLNTPSNTILQYKLVPYPADECEFRPKIQKWSGEF